MTGLTTQHGHRPNHGLIRMTDTQLPKALQLADWLDCRTMKMLQDRQAADELRRLHAELEQARAALAAQGEPVGEVFTMEALGTPGKPFCHVLLNRTLPTGTKIYTAAPAKPMTDEQIMIEAARHLGEMHVENAGIRDILDFARAILALRPAQAADQWREAVEERFAVNQTDMPEDPREAIKKLIATEVRDALDPTISSAAAALAQAGGAMTAARKDAVFQASIEFIGTLTGMTPPPIEVAPPEVFAPFRDFTNNVCAIFENTAAPNKEGGAA